jgi:hypothetical protein
MSGSIQLREYPREIVRLSCPKCGRAGQYRKQILIERYGTDTRLPDLREEIAQCGRQGKMHDACMVQYEAEIKEPRPITRLHIAPIDCPRPRGCWAIGPTDSRQLKYSTSA